MEQDNTFIRNSWGTELFATVEDSVLRNSWGTELGCIEGQKGPVKYLSSSPK
jgi:hypothetical protein